MMLDGSSLSQRSSINTSIENIFFLVSNKAKQAVTEALQMKGLPTKCAKLRTKNKNVSASGPSVQEGMRKEI